MSWICKSSHRQWHSSLFFSPCIASRNVDHTVARTRLLQAGVPTYSMYESRGSIELVSHKPEPVECTEWMERLEASGKSLNKVTDRLGYILTRIGSSM